MANSNFLITFLKLIVLTTALFGSLVAQSYATNLISDSITEKNFEVTASCTKVISLEINAQSERN